MKAQWRANTGRCRIATRDVPTKIFVRQKSVVHKEPKRYSGRFIHGINTRNWYPCWNLDLDGRLRSPDFLALIDPGLAAAHRPLRDTPVEELKTLEGLQSALTPRAARYVGAAALIRRGGHVGIGAEETRWLDPASEDEILRLGDIELAFEEARRKLLPEGASRLASLYLADDSDSGRGHIRAMLGDEVTILKVTIPFALRVTRVDTGWFDRYCREAKPEYIKNYWASIPINKAAPTWEYLVDGMIELDDPEGLEYVRQVGAHRFIKQGNSSQ